MSLPWRSHITITPQQAQQYIEEQVKDITIKSITEFGQGWDNIAFLVNNQLVFRFAKTNETALLLQQENKILPQIQNLSLPLPNPIIIGKPTVHNPYYFHAYKKLPGIPAYQTQVSNNNMKVITQKLALFLKQLHSIDKNHCLKIGATPTVYDRADVHIVSENLIKYMHFVNKFYSLNTKYINQYVQDIKKIRLPNIQTMVHGDLDSRHILINNNYISGVIDWGDIGIAHPVTDLAVVYYWIPSHFHTLFFDIYGTITPEVAQYAQFLAFVRAITLIMYAHGIQDQQLLQDALKKYHQLIIS